MGLEKAKSLLEVKDGKTFLDLIADQIKYTRQKYGSKVKTTQLQLMLFVLFLFGLTPAAC